jgi:CrcB protein
MWHKLIWLAAAGALGTLARYSLGGLAQRLGNGDFPTGTLIVNAAGCFLFGLIWSLAEGRTLISGEARTVALVGFMGAFTTFSTLMFETSGLVRDSQWMAAALNLGAQNLSGLLLMFLGLAAGRVL